jgi:hypothetical protein
VGDPRKHPHRPGRLRLADPPPHRPGRYDAPEAPGFDVALRGRSMICDDDERILALTGPLFDGLYEYHRRAMLLGHEPA